MKCFVKKISRREFEMPYVIAAFMIKIRKKNSGYVLTDKIRLV